MQISLDRDGPGWQLQILLTPAEPGVTVFEPDRNGFYLAKFKGLESDIRVRFTEIDDAASVPRTGVELVDIQRITWMLRPRPGKADQFFEGLRIDCADVRSLNLGELKQDKRKEVE